ncbi:hypothetical protein LINPERHAP1_LOCUS14144, partial [Linum perenne]
INIPHPQPSPLPRLLSQPFVFPSLRRPKLLTHLFFCSSMFSSVHSLHSEIAPHSSSLHLSSVTASTATPLYRQISEVPLLDECRQIISTEATLWCRGYCTDLCNLIQAHRLKSPLISSVWIRLRHISRSRSCLSINDFVSPTNSFSDSGARERNRMMHQAFLPRSLLYRSA